VATDLAPWLVFAVLVGGLLALDLGIGGREHEPSRKEALLWSAGWIGLALAFNAGVYVYFGAETGIEWTTGYLIEKSLSVDNVFIFLLIFSSFAVPVALQRRVLLWGIVGAIVLRAVLIALAGVVLGTLHFVVYVFGAFLVFTGIRFLRDQEHEPDLEKNRMVRMARKLVPTTPAFVGERFFVRRNGILMATPLFLVLVVIEGTDLVFAVDSIPAIYAVSDRPFVVFTSNIFAVLGLRSLYFVLNGYLAGLRFLKPALAAILVFVGAKLLLVDLAHIPPVASLAVIAAILATAIVASIRWPAVAAPALAERAPALE